MIERLRAHSRERIGSGSFLESTNLKLSAPAPASALRSRTAIRPVTKSIRPLTRDDVPAVAALFERVYPEHRWPSTDALVQYLHETLFGNPWAAADLPSWVSEKYGRVTGVAGLMPRPMVFRDRPIRAAVICLFMVDPDERRSMTARKLLKTALAGPQDLSFGDGSNNNARRLCLSVGGCAPLLYSLHWMRPLRPGRYALSLFHGLGGAASLAAHALAYPGRLADALLARLGPNRFHQAEAGYTTETLDAATLASNLPAVLRGHALRPVYDAPALDWLLKQAARKKRHGRLRARAVYDGRRQIAGWFLYYVQPGEIAEVLQVSAHNGAFGPVLQCLLSDAWRQGATAIRGRVDPARIQEMSDRHCWLRREGTWTVVHSRHSEICAAFERGDAELSRLDGEWWMRFLGG